MPSYSQEFKANMVSKMMPPNAKSPAELTQETGIPYQTLWNWKTKALSSGSAAVGSSRSSNKWSDESKLAIIIETAALNAAETSEYCRAKGIFPEQIQQWRAAAVVGQSKALSKTEREELQAIKKENKILKKELARKEKALAEAAALMILRKKADAIWGEPEDD